MTKEKDSVFKQVLNRYFIHGLNGMALGLFSTLIIGLIIKQIGSFIGGDIGTFITAVGTIAGICTGSAIGMATAYCIGAPKLVIFSSAVTGMIGANAAALLNGKIIVEGVIRLTGPGDPLGAFIAVIAGIEIGRLVSGRTPIDIIFTPFVTIISGSIVGAIVGPPISQGMIWLGNTINIATELQPFLMGIIVSVIMGMVLTMPMSSAALAIILGLTGLPAGAATVGCATQMVGFAVASFRENKWNGLLAQGIGTSKLQMPNIVKNPRIWIPTILTSAILGPLATCVFKMESNSAGAGMGTSGFVGQIMTWQTMSVYTPTTILIFKIVLLHFLLPAIITLIISEFMRRKGYIKLGDMKLEV